MKKYVLVTETVSIEKKAIIEIEVDSDIKINKDITSSIVEMKNQGIDRYIDAMTVDHENYSKTFDEQVSESQRFDIDDLTAELMEDFKPEDHTKNYHPILRIEP